MKDILNIKKMMFFNFINERFIILFLLFLLGLIFIWILVFIYKKYKRNIEMIEQSALKKIKMKEKYLKLIKGIKNDDSERFFKLNLYVRDYLEKSSIIEKSTKKTKRELQSQNNDLNNFFEICEKAEFASSKEFDFETTRNIAKDIVNN